MSKSTTTVTVHGLPLTVDFDYQAAFRGERDIYGAPLTPDEPIEVTVEEVYLGGWEILDLMSDDAIVKVRDAVLKAPRE